jgi:hypothetical protein
MAKLRTHRFNGVRYYVDADKLEGWCDRPRKPDKREYPTIHLPQGLRGRGERRAKIGLITLIHEALHAENWDEREAVVERVAREVGGLLWRMGYRKK